MWKVESKAFNRVEKLPVPEVDNNEEELPF